MRGIRDRIGLLCLLAGFGLAGPGAAAQIVINEIMYNAPGSPDPAFVELFNAGPQPVDLTGWTMLDDDDLHDPCPLSGTIPSGGFLVVVESSIFFQAYPGVAPVNPAPFGSDLPGVGFSLSKSSDTVRVFDAGGTLVDQVPYSDSPPWPTQADGGGSSLELVNPSIDNSLSASWAASPIASPPGSPGAVNDSFDLDLTPVIENLERTPALPGIGQSVVISARIVDDLDVPSAMLWVDDGTGFVAQPMFDDGLHDDGAAQDGRFGATIDPRPQGTAVRFYLLAQDGSLQTTTLPPTAPTTWFGYTVGHVPPRLVINEFVASNQNGILDELGDRDDWLELRNADVEPIDLGGLYLSDDPGDGTRWSLPAVTLPPGGFVLLWCDSEPAQGPFHAEFNLPRAGGYVGVFDSIATGNTPLDERFFGPQNPDVSFGFLPDDADRAEYIATPTPAASNDGATAFSNVVINEVLTGSGFGVADFVEFYNRGSTSINLGGWFLSDDATQAARYPIPGGTILAPGALVSFDSDDLGFGFSSAGDEVVLLTAPDEITGYDYLDLDPLPDDVSFGRLPDGGHDWHVFSAWTRDVPNACPGGIAGPAAVVGLRFDSPVVARWDPVPGATGYDVARGDLASLRSGGTLTGAICHENNVAASEVFSPEAVLPEAGLFYVARAVTSACGFGSYESGSSAELPGRDAALDGPPACP